MSRDTYNASVLADSISPDGVRLTTLEVTFPRFILAEVNTHRMLSRNSASSRAIPPEQMIERVRRSPFVPETFNKRVKGMGVGEALVGDDAVHAEKVWLSARDEAVAGATELLHLDCDKSRINRLLEPFLWHTAVISATEWDNFFALRDHPHAQPEIQIMARCMRAAMAASTPWEMGYGCWHLPYVTEQERRILHDAPEQIEVWKLASAGRCARVSYDTQGKTEELMDSVARGERLRDSVPPHISPFEHVARPIEHDEAYDLLWRKDDNPALAWEGNFRGWHQMRKDINHEARADLAIDEAHTETLAG